MVFALALVLAAGNPAKTSTYPFDNYITAVKQHRPTARITRFANVCGTPITALLPVYGIGGYSKAVPWKLSRNFPKDVYDMESDFLSTAEIWRLHYTPRVIDIWSTDAETEEEDMFCLERDGTVKFMRKVYWALPSDGLGWWEFRQDQRFDANGKWVVTPGRFFDMNGHALSTPKLDSDDELNIQRIIDTRKLNEFQFPSKMLR